MRARIEDHLRRISFDLIIANGLYALLNVPQTGVPIILNCHNVEYIIIERFAAIEKSYAKKRYAVREAQWVRDAEEQACKRVTTAMVCSDYDRQLIRQLRPELPVFVVPNVVDTYSYTPAEAEHVQKGDCVILFQGSMDWYPNRDAVEFFALKIFPVIRGRYPSARFVVAGRNPSPRFVHKFNLCDGVEFTGTVPDMRPYLAAATVIVVPLRLGSGTRIKILEGCAAGKPVVSTRVGAEGLDLRPGIEILLADEPAEFAQKVIRLLENPQLQNAIGQSARAKAVACYSQSNVNGIIGKAISSASRESATSEAIQ